MFRFVFFGVLLLSLAANADDPKPRDIVDVEIAKGVKMKFCWIPEGKATLGSPVSEKFRVKDEKEHEFTTKGFWLGKYEVTQEQWQAVMGNNPSDFSKNGDEKDRVRGLNTSKFPVETVSWNDCQAFIKKLNDKSKGVASVPRSFSGKYALPHEDQWEYACRGGKGNKQPFYFGGESNGRQANCAGTHPYGTSVPGPNLKRPTTVGSYETDHPHPWGLCDMHGNVWEWCDNIFEGQRRAWRGGGWSHRADESRSAIRVHAPPEERNDYLGFRLIRVSSEK